jgi:hypothetical protein
MFRTPFPLILLLPPLLFGTACAPQEGFPSLAPRAVENLSMEEPVREILVVATDPALGSRIVELEAAAARGEAEFAAILPQARANSAGAGAAGSESWIEAQQAISRLEAARAQTVSALADLDRLAIERATLPTNIEQFERLRTAIERTTALALGQQAEIDAFRGRLSSG